MGRSGGGPSGSGRSSGGFGGNRSSGGFSGGGRSSGSHSSNNQRSSSSNHSSGGFFSGGTGFFGGNSRDERDQYYESQRRKKRKTVYVPVPERSRNQNVEINPLTPASKIGCMIVLIAFLMVSLVTCTLLGNDQKENTTVRTALNGQVNKTDWYQDNLNWISNKQVLIDGLEEFYKETGIQPYVLLQPYDAAYWNVDGSGNANAMDAYLEAVYEERFTDEAHLIFAYFAAQNDSREEMEGEFRYLCGYSADTIMDSEALKIFWGYFESNYYDTSLTLESMIADTFVDTGIRIMSRPTNMYDVMPLIFIIILVIVTMVCLVMIINMIFKRSKEEEEYTKKILETPLETFDTGIDTSDIEKKYEDQ